MPRREQHRRLKTNYAVLGDGQTEQYYLKHLKTIKDYKYSVYPSLFSDISIENAEIKIDELLSGGCDLIIYFTDYDTIVKQDKKEKFETIVKKYENIPEVLICESMPSIEFWFLLHYKKTTMEFENYETVKRELKKFIRNYSKGKAFLSNMKWVHDLCSNGKLEKALNNAAAILKQKQIEGVGKHFPFTKAHLGIEKFEEQKNKNIF